MQVTEVRHPNLRITELAKKPFDGESVSAQTSQAPHAIGEIYTRDGAVPKVTVGTKIDVLAK